jgi:hypothetical protein
MIDMLGVTNVQDSPLRLFGHQWYCREHYQELFKADKD